MTLSSQRALSPLEAAQVLGIGQACVDRFIRDGLLTARALPQSFAIDASDLEDFTAVYEEFRQDYRTKGHVFINVGLPKARIKGVYFVLSNRHVKIGHASDIRSRILGLQTSHPELLQLLAWEDGGYKRERELHQQFAAHRERGEWFRPEGDLREHIAQTTAWYWGFH